MTLPATDPAPAEAWLVLPGLNLHPDRLDPAAAICLAAGNAVVRPRLTGYARPGDPALAQVRAADWLADLDRTWRFVQARLPTAAPSLLGYSLGGLLGLTWAFTRGIPLRRALLLAPALRLKRAHGLALRVLGTVLPGRLPLPSLAPAAYRLHATTPVAAYRALGMLERRLRPQLNQWLTASDAGLPPTLLIGSQRDELVDARALVALARAQPERVTWVPLSHAPRPGYPHHLSLDSQTLGDAEWRRLTAEAAEWLRRTSPAGRAFDATAPPRQGAV